MEFEFPLVWASRLISSILEVNEISKCLYMNPHMIKKEKSIIAPYLVLHSCKWSQENATTVNKHSTHHIAIVEALKKKI